MNTCTTESPKVAGIHELAREHLTTLCDEFLDGDPVRIVSAWRMAERMDPEDLADSYEGPYGLRLRVIDDLGCEQAEAGWPTARTGRARLCGTTALSLRDSRPQGPMPSHQSGGTTLAALTTSTSSATASPRRRPPDRLSARGATQTDETKGHPHGEVLSTHDGAKSALALIHCGEEALERVVGLAVGLAVDDCVLGVAASGLDPQPGTL